MKLLNGYMQISWLKLMNFKTSRKRLRAFAIPLSRSCINKLVVLEECLVVCMEECLVVCLEECLEECLVPMNLLVDLEVPRLKKLISVFLLAVIFVKVSQYNICS